MAKKSVRPTEIKLHQKSRVLENALVGTPDPAAVLVALREAGENAGSWRSDSGDLLQDFGGEMVRESVLAATKLPDENLIRRCTCLQKLCTRYAKSNRTLAMNKQASSYDAYVNDDAFLNEYNAYQNKYALNIRESDKILIHGAGGFCQTRPLKGFFKLLDIGCSTGNLLLHLKNLIPGMELVGGELAESSLALCRANPKLSGMRFERLDMLNLPDKPEYNVIIANAVAVYFYWDEYAKAAQSCNRALKNGGTYLAFEWLHPFTHQDITITETTMGHPDGLRICFRPMPRVASVFKDAGFDKISFHPFELPIELPKPGFDEEVVSYTVKSADNKNLCFRGTLFQPWCHMSAVKA